MLNFWVGYFKGCYDSRLFFKKTIDRKNLRPKYAHLVLSFKLNLWSIFLTVVNAIPDLLGFRNLKDSKKYLEI